MTKYSDMPCPFRHEEQAKELEVLGSYRFNSKDQDIIASYAPVIVFRINAGVEDANFPATGGETVIGLNRNQ